MLGLGNLYNVALAFAPVDLDTANGATGLRIYLRDYESVDFVFIKDAGTAGEDPDLGVQQHTAYTGGTSADLATVTRWWSQEETTLDGDEGWTANTQTAAASIDLGATCAECEQLAVVHVEASELSDGYGWVSLNATVTASNPQFGTAIAILNKPKYAAAPDRLKLALTGA